MKSKFTTILCLLMVGVMVSMTACKKKEGCTDPDSLTYDPDAKKDNGTCVLADQQRKTLLLEFSAAWCPPCGSWGNDAFHKMIDDYSTETVAISSHGSNQQPDGMTNKYSDGFKGNFPIGGWPNFYVGSIFKGTDKNIEAEMDQYRGAPIIANGATIYTVEGNNIIVHAKGKFFQSTTGDYYLAVYVLEDNIPGGDGEPSGFDQQGDNTQTYVHDHVLRRGASDDVFGDKIASGNITVGTQKELAYLIPVDQDWNMLNIELIGVIFKKNGGTYEYVNAWKAVEVIPEEE